MPTRNVVLTDHQNILIERLLAAGHYQNASEILRAGLLLLEEREAKLEALRRAVQAGVDDLDTGRYATFETSSDLGQWMEELTSDVLAEHRGGG